MQAEKPLVSGPWYEHAACAAAEASTRVFLQLALQLMSVRGCREVHLSRTLTLGIVPRAPWRILRRRILLQRDMRSRLRGQLCSRLRNHGLASSATADRALCTSVVGLVADPARRPDTQFRAGTFFSWLWLALACASA
jgi:hypothetical protein